MAVFEIKSWNRDDNLSNMKKMITFSLLLCLVEVCQGLNFWREFIYVTIYEEEPAGSFVARARAGPGNVTYKLGANAGKKFAINSITGNITVQAHLDREVLNSTDGEFTVFAFDDVGDKASASVHYWIIDINDHLPRFPHQYYNITVGESIDINQQIFSVTAQDEDLEANAEILYEITDGNEDGMFKLQDAYHCNVLVAKALDFESRSSYLLNITASNYKSSFSNWTVLAISVSDEDDLPARFSTYEYSALVREDAAVGTFVLKVTATDQDKLSAPVTYEIFDPSDKQALFVIDASTGVIILNGTLDRESRQEYMLQVLAHSTFHLPDHVTVVIHIGDVNDNQPLFSNQSYSFAIAENAGTGSIVGQVEATDADQGDNATFVYSMLGCEEHFAVDPRTGVITVSGLLDREKQEIFRIVIFAKETQTVERYTSNVTVMIEVEDRNDNTPHFVQSFYNVTLKEEQPSGTPVVQVFANDSDSSSNADVSYSLVPDANDHYLGFNINPTNGSITTTKQLDREDISEYLLTVKAEDGASKDQRRSSTVSVKVTLQDVNDNVPTFDKQFYAVMISEATNVNTTILAIKATDKDAGKNGEVTYTLEDGNIRNTFNIDYSKGTIRVAEYFDREKVGNYSLIVTAKDGGNKSTTVNVTVYVSDVNDNSPQFTSPDGYQFSVLEGTAGLTVGTVKATDNDAGKNAVITYSLMPTPASKSFRINSSSGVISTGEALDHETFRSHLLIVQAEDKGTPQSLRTAVRVSINVTDVNDNAPKFFEGQPDLDTVENNLLCGTYNITDSIVIRVQDFTPANTEISRVKSFDKDGDAVNAKIFYRIQGNSSEVFSIASQTGIIRTNRQLKREEISTYNVTVIAENSLASPKLSSNVTLHVIVYDVSDHRPQFTRSEFEAEVVESVASGTSVIQINVTNSEQAASRFVFKILYDESSADSRKFVIEPETGLITTQGQLDRETTANYTLMVQAKVLNTVLPQVFSNVVPVFINVTDVDDNALRFLLRSYRFITSELSRVGDVIGQVKAVDKDTNSQSNVFYSITGGNEKGLFNISEDLGTIYLNRTLEQDANATYLLVITARNTRVGLGSRKRRAEDEGYDEVTVTIDVQDENNNAPVFTREFFIGAFYEAEAKEKTVVAKVQAYDKDLAPYGSVQYSIVQTENPGLFSLAPITGEVTLFNLSALVSGKRKYTLAVSAADNLGKAPYNSAKQNASVHIFVLSDSNKLSVVIGVNPEFAQGKINEISSMLRNLSGATVIMKDIQEVGDGKSIIYFHAVDDNLLHVLKQEDFLSRLLNKTDLINGIFKKWNIHTPSNGPASQARSSTQEFNALVAAMLVLSVGVGVAGIIGIVVACRKRIRDKTIYKTTDTRESSFQHATAWYSVDIPGIEAFIDSKAEGTPQSLRSHTKYTVQKEQPGISGQSLLRTSLRSSKTYKVTDRPKKEVEIPSMSLLRTPVRSSKTYKLTNGPKKEAEKETVALNHYGSAPSPPTDHKESKEIYETVESVTGNATAVMENVKSRENAGFDDCQGEEKFEESAVDVGDLEETSKIVGEKPELGMKERRVRFDLRGGVDRKERKQRRAAMGHVPDIIVITEKGTRGGKIKVDEREKGGEVVDDEDGNNDDDGNVPADITSVFDGGSSIGNPPQSPGSPHMSAVSDEEGTVVEI